MSLALAQSVLPQPVLHVVSEPCRHVEAFRLGMPHLAYGGVAETWLLKELGHRHWMLLAKKAGRAVPDFRDERGMPVYAAFRAVSIESADLGRFIEHDELTIESELTRISRTQFVSLHTLRCNGVPAGMVELCSIFVTRQKAGSNRSIARIALDQFGPLEEPARESHTAMLAREIGSGRWRRHAGFANEAGEPRHRMTVRPCPSQDFNGADFLYFACFQGFVDRAEWEYLGKDVLGMTTAARDIVYHGNIELGESLVVEVQAVRETSEGIAHWCRLARADDGAPLADVFTERRR